MKSTRKHRNQPSSTPQSPRLQKSRSGSTAVSLPEIEAYTQFSNQRFNLRSKSRTEENAKPLLINSGIQKRNQEILQRKNPQPSAWALSPGRGSPSLPPAKDLPISGESKVKKTGGGGGRISGVLKYFRQKKASLVEVEVFHQYRVMHNRLLQWRFVNARAQVVLPISNKVAQDKLLGVWLRIFQMRKSIVEKQIQVQKTKNETKYFHIIYPQIILLNKWVKLEKRNCEAVSRVTRKLSASSLKLPLPDDVKANVESVYEAISLAMMVMNDFEGVITKYFYQAEKVLYLLTELVVTIKQEEECMEEIEKFVIYVSTLAVKEETLRVHLIQAAKEEV